jgi:hypothetical protein
MKQKPSYAVFIIATLTVLLFDRCDNQKRLPVEQGQVEPHIISIRKAQTFTASFRSGQAELQKMLRDTSYLSKNFQMPIAVQFNKEVLSLLLRQKDSGGSLAQGIRMYFARNELNQVTLVLVPYDGKNNDIVNRLIDKDVAFIPGITSAYAQTTTGQAVDNALRCPTFCDRSNSGLSLQ